MKNRNNNWILILLTVILVIVPLITMGGSEFGGADGQAEEAIMEINPEYEPWFESFWEPPSGEIESLLFSLQAALGSGVICYYLGVCKGKKKVATHR